MSFHFVFVVFSSTLGFLSKKILIAIQIKIKSHRIKVKSKIRKFGKIHSMSREYDVAVVFYSREAVYSSKVFEKESKLILGDRVNIFPFFDNYLFRF